MSSKSLKNGRVALVAAAVCVATAPSPSFAEYVADGDFTIGANVASEVGSYDSATYTVTLADDVTIDGKLTIADGVTIDLAGHKLTASAFESANLVVNGDFETDPLTMDGTANFTFPNTGWAYYGADNGIGYGYEPPAGDSKRFVQQFQWEGWVNGIGGGGLATPASSDWVNSNFKNDIGKYAAILHGPGTGTYPQYAGRYLAQELSTVPAGDYKWSFKYASRSSRSSREIKFDFLLEKSDGTTLETLLSNLSINNQTTLGERNGTATVPEAGTYTLKLKVNSGTGASEFEAGAVFDDIVLKKVSVITDSGTGTPGELHITGENGASALNGDISVGGNLKVVLHEMTIDGDLTANVDTVLAGDVTVNGALTMSQGVTFDLNGNELTAQGVDGDASADWIEKTTDLTSPSGTITDSGNLNAGYSGATLFNNNKTHSQSNRILMNGVSSDKAFWVTYDFGEGNRRKIASYKVYSRSSDFLTRGPKDWELLGSNTGNENDWTPVDSRTGVTWTGSQALNGQLFPCAYPGAYRYYRWKCTASSDNYLDMHQLEYFGTVVKPVVTDTSAGTPGKLRLAVPEGETLTNSKVAISGNLDFVKDGEGTFTCATEGLMTYLGDTYIDGGTYLCGLNGSKHPFGGGNIVVNGNFDAEPLSPDGNTFVSIASSGYKYRVSSGSVQFLWKGWLDEGSGAGLARAGSSFVASGQNVGTYAAFIHTNGSSGKGRNIYQDLFLAAGKYKWSFRYAKRPNKEKSAYDFNLIQNSTSTTTKLKSLSPSSTTFSTASGTVEVSEAGTYRLQFIATNQGDFGAAFDDVVFERIPEVHIASGATLDLNGKSGFGNYKFVGEGGTIVNSGAAISENLVVSGVFAPVVTTGSFGVVLQDGATLDLTKWTGSFPIASPAVSFASGAAITVNLAGRRVGPYIYIVKWDSIPSDVTFTLDPEAAGRYKVKAKGDGLMLVRKGFMIMVM